MALDLVIIGVAFAAGFIAWCRWVPDEQARVRGMIVVWIAMPLVETVIFVARRL